MASTSGHERGGRSRALVRNAPGPPDFSRPPALTETTWVPLVSSGSFAEIHPRQLMLIVVQVNDSRSWNRCELMG